MAKEQGRVEGKYGGSDFRNLNFYNGVIQLAESDIQVRDSGWRNKFGSDHIIDIQSHRLHEILKHEEKRKKCPRTDSWGIPTLKDVEYKEDQKRALIKSSHEGRRKIDRVLPQKPREKTVSRRRLANYVKSCKKKKEIQ